MNCLDTNDSSSNQVAAGLFEVAADVMFRLNTAIVLSYDFFEKLQYESFNFYEEIWLLFQILAESVFVTANLVLFSSVSSPICVRL